MPFVPFALDTREELVAGSRGSDAYVFRGDWQAGGWTAPMQGVVDLVPYRARDGVLHGGILWTTPTDPAPDGGAPGTAGTPWLALAVPVSSLPATSVATDLRFRSLGPWQRNAVLGEALVARPQKLANQLAGGLVKAISTQTPVEGQAGATFGRSGALILSRNGAMVARWVFQAGSNDLYLFAWPPADLALAVGDVLRLVIDYDYPGGVIPSNEAATNAGVTVLASLTVYETATA